MADSNYPNSLDTDLELPQVDDNITEIGGEAINGLRSAVFNIEETLGLDPHGAAADVATRLDQSLNPDGTIKASALSAVGLVTLPITNSQIATNAAVEELKLDLDYSTVQLKTWIDELNVFMRSVNEKVIVDIFNLSQHIAHPSAYGRHWTQDIDGYTGTYASYNLQGIITDLDTRIIDHVTDLVDAHDASAISADDTNLDFTATDVQTALEGLNDLGITAVISHQNNQHGNGILRTQNTNLNNSDHNKVLVTATSILGGVTAGDTSIQFSSAPTGLAEVLRGDVVEIDTGTDTYRFDVNKIETGSPSVVYIFGNIPVSVGSATATIYRTSEETYAPSPLILTLRQTYEGGSAAGAIVQMIHPSAPYLLSNGADPRSLSSTIKNIKIAWSVGSTTGETEEIDVHSMMQNFAPTSGYPIGTWTVENFVVALNNLFRAESTSGSYSGSGFPYHYPLIAFAYKGEIGIALDEGVDGYVELRAIEPPSSNGAWSALGFVEGDRAYYVEPRSCYIDGYEISSVRKIIDTTGEINSAPDGIINMAVNPTTSGVPEAGIVRLKNSSTDDGTYVYNNISVNTLLIAEHNFVGSGGSIDVEVYADSFRIKNEIDHVLYELFVDGYENTSVELRGAERVKYRAANTGNPEEWFDIISISRNLGASEMRIYIDGSDNVTLGERSGLIGITNPGESVNLYGCGEGYVFKLYDAGGVNYVELMIVDTGFSGSTNGIDLDIFDRISEEKYIQVGTVTYNAANLTTSLSHLEDTRAKGTVRRKDIGEDYTRDYVTYPVSRLRGCGVFRGLEMSGVGGSTLTVTGGEVLVDGIVYQIEGRDFAIPEDSASLYYLVYVDNQGVLQLQRDNYHASGVLTTPEDYNVSVSSDKAFIGGLSVNSSNVITWIGDYRRFVGTIDEKLEITVSDDPKYGSFTSLHSAVNWIGLQETGGGSPSCTITVKGQLTVDLSDTDNYPVPLPYGCTLRGDGRATGSLASKGGRILLQNSGASYAVNVRNGIVRDLDFQFDSGASCSYILSIGDNGVVERCLFDNVSTSALNLSGTSIRIIGNRFYYISSGTAAIVSSGTMTDAIVAENYLDVASSGSAFMNLGSNDLSYSFVRNNYAKFRATGVFITCDDVSYSTVESNTILFTGSFSGTGNRGIDVDDFTYVRVVNNTCFGVGTFISADTINQSSISGNHFNSIYRFIQAMGGFIDVIIDSNIIVSSQSMDDIIYALDSNYVIITRNDFQLNGTVGSVIDVGGSYAYYVLIQGNNITIGTSSTSAGDMIVFGSSAEITISDNFLGAFANQTPANSIIHFSGNIDWAVIANNVIENMVSSSLGMLYALYFSSTGSTGNAVVTDNTILDFNGTGGAGIKATEHIFKINDNYIYNCYNCLNLTSEAAIGNIISGNRFFSSASAITVYLNWTTASDEGRNIFTNNYVYNDTATAAPLVQISGAQNKWNVITNNVLEFGQASVDRSLLFVDGAFHVISNNVFVGDSFTHATYAPVLCYADDTLISNNVFAIDIASVTAATMIKISGATNVVDYFNKGQTYQAILPFSNSDGDMTKDIGVTSNVVLYSTTIGDAQVLEFTARDVPVGAEITTIEVLMESALSSSWDALTVALYERDSWDEPTNTTQIAYDTFKGTSSTPVVKTISSVSFEMGTKPVCLKFDSEYSSNLWIWTPRITYIL